MRKASINERNALFGALKQAAPGGVLLYPGHRFETAAREFEAEGLASLESRDVIDGGGFRVAKAWK
ncbi:MULTISPECIES: hypothetical protein [Bradyrhizobium]|jgi:hypothetical protein|uniref:hypothetical protein n=1 Tax=Bradyrhizobium TaxID=374 RepID=UPI0004B5A741|nr:MULTISPECIES: hypothetical protein [Bradyrhizobium]MBR0998797.1 hypothetical protein [Bradyrhizobium liaoningense]MBR1030077.1 hypothetical protein [Bradyrhizobium liaoningense]MBR1066868.1 hypothetical protein [Bradyrhizobium liaoningense]MDI2074499.1 hypothetical protein [Bradyrhizobium sp. Mp27]